MTQVLKVEGHPEFIRAGAAIVNSDMDAYKEFMKINTEKKQLEVRVQSLEDKLDRILNLMERGYGSNQ